jgi:small GTP-binding protein
MIYKKDIMEEEEEEEEEEVCKIVLIGEAGVGKTCIISRFINNTYRENNITTTGASYASKVVTFPEYGNRKINFEIWDTAGQEKFRSINQLFYKEASICILVYDMTRESTFNALQDYWCQQILDNTPKNTVVGIAGNKCDLIENEKVSEEKGKNLANEINAIYESTSAAKGIGVESLFHNLGCKFIDPNFKVGENSNNEYKTQINKETNQNKNNNKSIRLVHKKNSDKQKKKKCC